MCRKDHTVGSMRGDELQVRLPDTARDILQIFDFRRWLKSENGGDL